MTAFLSIIIALVSGVSAALVGYWLNAQKEHIFFIRGKFESAYLATERLQRTYLAHCAGYLPLMKNEITYNQLLELQIDDLKKNDVAGYESLAMLINIYFPQLRPELDRTQAAMETTARIISDHKREYKAHGPTDRNWVDTFVPALGEFDAAMSALKVSIAALAQDFASAKSLAWARNHLGLK